MTAPFLTLRNVVKSFGSFRALDDVNWEIFPGEIHCLVGENGCGKSTLIKTVAGVHAPDPGSRLFIDGQDVTPLTPARATMLGVQVIYQDLSLFPNLSIAENIGIRQALGPLSRPVNRRAMHDMARSTLKRLEFDLPLDLPVSALSIAERQIVAIARGLASNARLLFMDEPTASLTRTEVRRLLDLVHRLSAEGVAIVFVSHRLEEVASIARRITVMRDGRFIGTYAADTLTPRRIAELMTGLSFESKPVSRGKIEAPCVLEVDRLSRAGEYENVTFSLCRGEVLGIVGLLGSGRTELALSLFGMTRPDSGEIRLAGVPRHFRSNGDALAAGIAYVSEDRLNLGLNARQSIESNLTVAILPRLAKMFGLIPHQARRQTAQSWITRLSIKIGRLDDPISTLSGGNQQRVILARWLATNPKVLILDSPTVGVDIKNKRGIYEVIQALSEQGVGVIVISDEIPELFATCDRVLHMRTGQIVSEMIPGPVTEQDMEEHVYA